MRKKKDNSTFKTLRLSIILALVIIVVGLLSMIGAVVTPSINSNLQTQEQSTTQP